MSELLRRLFPRRRACTSRETTEAIGVAGQVAANLDQRMKNRHREVAIHRLDQMRIRREIRRDPITDAFREGRR